MIAESFRVWLMGPTRPGHIGVNTNLTYRVARNPASRYPALQPQRAPLSTSGTAAICAKQPPADWVLTLAVVAVCSRMR